jgi:two-component system CheB/CheR fusion protein
MSNQSSGSVDPAISKSQLFQLSENPTDLAIFTMDPTSTTTNWNIGAERLFGFTESEMIGSTAVKPMPN